MSIGPVLLRSVLPKMSTPIALRPRPVLPSMKDWPSPLTESAPLVEASVAPERRTPLPKLPCGSKLPLTLIEPVELLSVELKIETP